MFVESRDQLSEPLRGRDRRSAFVAAAAFAVVAGAMAAFGDPQRALDVPLMVGLVAAYALATRVEFSMGSGWAVPTELVFVPMLFLLPTPAVPLIVALALLVARIPEYASGAVHVSRAVLRVAEAWYAIGPALVLTLAGATTPDWGDWPIYLAALAAQFACDLAFTVARESTRFALPTRSLLDEMRAVYLVDTLLAPVGLLAAFASETGQWAFLLVLPLLGLIAIFAREREARIESALTLRDAYRGTAHLLGEVLATTHEYTGSHSRSVVVLARQVGVELGVSELILREIEFGALLHDVGKMAVPNEILNKPAALTDEEMRVVRVHTLEGERMLERIGGMLGEVGPVVRSHHENFDGSGYPDGLRGEEIPLASRIISACDAFHAMVSDRPYRKPLTIDEATTELRACAGSQFDPGVVETLVTIVETWGAPSEDGSETDPDLEPAVA